MEPDTKISVTISSRNGKSAHTRRKNVSVAEKRVRDEHGKVSVIRTIDASSKTFSDDLTYVFKRNVAKARRENKRVVGVSDLVPVED